MNIIVKDKKDIRWVGFPVNALFECDLIDVSRYPPLSSPHSNLVDLEKSLGEKNRNSRENSSVGKRHAQSKTKFNERDKRSRTSCVFQQIALINLIRRNEKRAEPKSSTDLCQLPFFALNTTNGASIEHFSLSRRVKTPKANDEPCRTFFFSVEKTILKFDRRVTYISENEILQRLGLAAEFRGEAKNKDEIDRACSLVPRSFINSPSVELSAEVQRL